MSYCGAVDRYPDTRDMGYPFARPFAGPRRRRSATRSSRWPNAAARTVTIRHASRAQESTGSRRRARTCLAPDASAVLRRSLSSSSSSTSDPCAGPRFHARRCRACPTRVDTIVASRSRASGSSPRCSNALPQRLRRRVEAAVVADLVEARAGEPLADLLRGRRVEQRVAPVLDLGVAGEQQRRAADLEQQDQAGVVEDVVEDAHDREHLLGAHPVDLRESPTAPPAGSRWRSPHPGRAAGRRPSLAARRRARSRRPGARTRPGPSSRLRGRSPLDCSSVGGPSTSMRDAGQQVGDRRACVPKLA